MLYNQERHFMEMSWTWKRFEEISGAEMHEMLSERQKVFIVEQKCVYQDADILDYQSWHLVGRDLEGMLVAYARINFPGARYKEPSFGRIFTSQANRAIGLGRQIIQHCIEKCKIEYNDICGFEVKDKYEINISIIVDYDPKQYLDSTKFDLSHRFDIPIENIRIKSSKCINYKQVFEFIEQYKKDLDKQEIE